VPEELTVRVHERTGGNPFFLEEIAHSLIEAGTGRIDAGRARVVGALATLHMPATVQAVIRTRLDRLDLELGPGATFVVASNGIGKTSLIMAAAGQRYGTETPGGGSSGAPEPFTNMCTCKPELVDEACAWYAANAV